MVDLSGYNLAQLRELQRDVEKEMENRNKQKLNDARDRLYAIAHDMNMSLEALLDKLGMIKPGMLKPGAVAGRAPVKVSAKYRHPEHSSQEWTGRGRMPAWVKNYMELTGKPLESLRIS